LEPQAFFTRAYGEGLDYQMCGGEQRGNARSFWIAAKRLLNGGAQLLWTNETALMGVGAVLPVVQRDGGGNE